MVRAQAAFQSKQPAVPLAATAATHKPGEDDVITSDEDDVKEIDFNEEEVGFERNPYFPFFN